MQYAPEVVQRRFLSGMMVVLGYVVFSIGRSCAAPVNPTHCAMAGRAAIGPRYAGAVGDRMEVTFAE